MMDDGLTLRSGDCRLAVSTLGAEMRDWRIGPDSLLWGGDPAWWPDRSPILFPVVGWTRNGEARVGGATYPLGVHGFARTQRFEVIEAGEARATLRLRETPHTLAKYPFRFELTVAYEVDPTGVLASFRVANRGHAPMPYALGLHPGFRLPFGSVDFGAGVVAFERAERGEVPIIAPGGLFSPERRTVSLTQGGRELPLTRDLFDREALCFMGVYSRSLRLSSQTGPALRIAWSRFPHVVLWSRPGAPFLCVEAWTGSGDPVGFQGDLFEKPGMTVLQAGDASEHSYRMSVEDPLKTGRIS
ncbi:aldose 1-epimerase family protein [Alsobacter sp. KACC 23698]|uniref:Aldose 1-epimerase family protein n=1 Tax=Alsobacter sp. KACC 23698 TaxID=3149229 RepID=A0AAU7JL41_9HYPH